MMPWFSYPGYILRVHVGGAWVCSCFWRGDLKEGLYVVGRRFKTAEIDVERDFAPWLGRV